VIKQTHTDLQSPRRQTQLFNYLLTGCSPIMSSAQNSANQVPRLSLSSLKMVDYLYSHRTNLLHYMGACKCSQCSLPVINPSPHKFSYRHKNGPKQTVYKGSHSMKNEHTHSILKSLLFFNSCQEVFEIDY
jgi:hypothetical protein